MFFLQLTLEEQRLIDMLGKPEVKDAIKEVIKHSQPDAITANQFFILSVTLALSVYISTISAETARRLRKENRLGRKDRTFERRITLFLLFIGDLLLWLILLPLIQHIHDFLKDNDNLSKEDKIIQVLVFLKTNPMDLGSWIASFIYIATIFMFIVHCVQWVKYCVIAFEKPSNAWIYRENFDTLIQNIPDTLDNKDLRVYFALTTFNMPQGDSIIVTREVMNRLRNYTRLSEAEINTSLNNLVAARRLDNQGNSYQMLQ